MKLLIPVLALVIVAVGVVLISRIAIFRRKGREFSQVSGVIITSLSCTCGGRIASTNLGAKCSQCGSFLATL